MFLGIIAFILVIYILKTQSDFVLPIVIAALLARLFEPSISWLHAKGAPKGVGLLLTLLGAGVLMAGVSLLIGVCGQQIAEILPVYSEKANEMLHGISTNVVAMMTRLGSDPGSLDLRHSIDPSTIVSIITSSFGSALGAVSTSVLVLFMMLMIIVGTDSILKGIKAGYGEEKLRRTEEFMTSVDSKVQKFLISKTMVNLITGTLTYIILSLFGLDLAFVFAVLTFFLSYIPAIGGLVAQILPMAMAFLQFDSSGKIAGMISILFVSNLLIDRVIEPKVMGKSLALSPLVVFMAFILFTWMWGTIGALIAVPITAIVKVAMEKSPATRPIALMMEE